MLFLIILCCWYLCHDLGGGVKARFLFLILTGTFLEPAQSPGDKAITGEGGMSCPVWAQTLWGVAGDWLPQNLLWLLASMVVVYKGSFDSSLLLLLGNGSEHQVARQRIGTNCVYFLRRWVPLCMQTRHKCVLILIPEEIFPPRSITAVSHQTQFWDVDSLLPSPCISLEGCHV